MVVPMRGLQTSVDASRVPPGGLTESVNARLDRGVVEGGPRWGGRTSRSGYAGSDEGRWFGRFEFDGSEEYIALVKQADGFVHVYRLNPATMGWTALTAGSVDPQALPNYTEWAATQFEGYAYFMYVGTATSAGFYRRKIGDVSTSAAWEAWSPQYEWGRDYGVSIERPDVQIGFGRVQGFYSSTSGSVAGSFSQIQPSGWTWAQTATGAGVRYFAMESELGIDMDLADTVLATLTRAGTWTAGMTMGLAVSEDTASAIDLAWCQSLRYDTVAPAVSGSIYRSVHNLQSSLGKAQNRKPVRRLVLAVTGEVTATPATLKLELLSLGGLVTYDVAAITKLQTAFRYEKTQNSPKVTTPAYRLRDIVVEELRGELVDASLARRGSVARFEIPYDSKRAGEGYDQIAYYVSQSVEPNPANYWIVGTGKNRPGETALVHTMLQSVVDARAVAVAPKERSPEQYLFDATGGAYVGWRGLAALGRSLALFGGRFAWLSYVGDPSRYAPPPSEGPTFADPDDPLAGRTLRIAANDDAYAAIDGGAGAWFLATKNGVYAMESGFPSEAGFPRLLPSSHGFESRRGAVQWRGGAAVALKHGLMYFSVTKWTGDTDVPANDPAVELTKDVRDTWKWLRGSAPEKVVLIEENDSLWAFCETRAMRLSRPAAIDGARAWEAYTFPHTVAAHWSPARGLWAMQSDGRVFQIDESYTTDGGAAAQFSATTGEMMFPRSKVVAVQAKAVGSPTVEITAIDGPDSQTVVLTGSGGEWRKSVVVRPGTRLKAKVSGTVGADKVQELELVVEPTGDAYGQ
jgi:hypothetical protein